ncbi:N-acetylneuraminate synthase family protein [Geobacter sp. DSM 9736]|uniref:N-acetylneuraminate synthase family protein n=1 Tax=Geobacter sp. DSM 9736 TaxID=1277350 RepID=UPI000B50D3DE|nr:N-acetylneuraminate synthase family protein [Geobacter sp. DSM 9736]SNB47015.1 N-acetylneuraminate synthase [Geobacter sp. DSM 9736]
MKKIRDLFSTSNKPHTLDSPYVIAEIGVNHEGNMDLAKRLIDEAQEGGADAVKFQTYKAETIASVNSPAYWDTTKEPTPNQFQLFKKYDKFWKTEFEQLKTYCTCAGIEFISTPFDVESAMFLNDLMEVFKISSSDITNRPFIELIGSFGKPIILSTGASFLYEIEEAVAWIERSGVPLALLHCILNYPTDDANANLAMITDLRLKFPRHIIGYSDHTLPKDMKTLEIAALLGAVILEKHFTHDKTLPGNDHYHAMDKSDLKLFRGNLSRVAKLLGSDRKHPLPSEEPARQNARRSLVAATEIPAGKTIEQSDLTWKRPASGVSPRLLSDIVGKKARRTIVSDEIITWCTLEE